MPTESFWIRHRCLLAALVIGGAVRLLCLVVFFESFQADPDAYRQIAENLANEGMFAQRFGDGPIQSTAYRPPLYPLTLSGFVADGQLRLLPVAIFHWALGIGTLIFVYRFGMRFGLGEKWAMMLSLLVACDPILLKQSSLVMTETMATFMGAALLWISTPANSNPHPTRVFLFWLGCLFGLATLCRPTFLIWAGLLWLKMFLIPPRGTNFRSNLLPCVLFMMGVTLVLSPWIIRNQLLFGKPIFATSHGGYTIFLGNNDSFYDYLDSTRSDLWNGEQELRADVLEIRQQSTNEKGVVDEVMKDRLYYQKSLETIQRRPGSFLKAMGVRILRFWSVIPAGESNPGLKNRLLQIGIVGFYGLLFLLAAIGLIRVLVRFRAEPTTRLISGILMVFAFQGLHLLYWSNMRMRGPLAPVICLLAIIGIRTLLEQLENRHRGPQ